MSVVIESSATSRRVSFTADSALPLAPRVPRSGNTLRSRRGGGGSAGNAFGTRGQPRGTGRSCMKRAKARCAQPEKSAPIAE